MNGDFLVLKRVNFFFELSAVTKAGSSLSLLLTFRNTFIWYRCPLKMFNGTACLFIFLSLLSTYISRHKYQHSGRKYTCSPDSLEKNSSKGRRNEEGLVFQVCLPSFLVACQGNEWLKRNKWRDDFECMTWKCLEIRQCIITHHITMITDCRNNVIMSTIWHGTFVIFLLSSFFCFP